MIVRSNFSDLYSASALPALEEMFKHELALHPMIRQQLFKIVSTQKDIWQAGEVTDLQNFLEVPEGTDYTMVKPRAGANKTLVPKKYGLGFSISEEAIDDGKFDFVADCVKKLAESAIDSQETSAIDVFNNGFGSATAWDGLSLFNAAHTMPSGLTFRNRLSVDADLSPASLDTMLTDFATQFKRDSGKLAMIKPKILLVHESQRRYANEILGSDLKADTNNNNMNSLKGEGIRVVTSSRLTDTDAWFLLADPSETGLRIISRKGVETKAAGPDSGFINDSIMYKSRYREVVGVTHASGVMGTTGA